MAKSVVVVCDRCAREIQGYDIKISSAKIQLWRVGEDLYGIRGKVSQVEPGDAKYVYLYFE